MRLDIRYRCRFDYDQPVRESQNELRAAPAPHDRQSLISYRVATSPPARVLTFEDYWGTRVDAFGVRDSHTHLEVVAESSVETRPQPLLTASPRVERLADPAFLDEHVEYLQRTAHTAWGPTIEAEARQQAGLVGPDVVSVVLALHRRVATTFTYRPGATYVGMDVEELCTRREGVCQDYAHVMIAMCRSLGIPARYVSGYLFTADDSTGDIPEGEMVEVQTHAWVEAAVPGHGWIALDPTNQQEVGERHVKIGHGRDYDDVQPLRGVFAGSATCELDVSVEIRKGTVTAAPAPTPRPHRQAQQAQQQQ